MFFADILSQLPPGSTLNSETKKKPETLFSATGYIQDGRFFSAVQQVINFLLICWIIDIQNLTALHPGYFLIVPGEVVFF